MEKYWAPLTRVVDSLVVECDAKHYTSVLEVGPGQVPFPRATTQIDVTPCVRRDVETLSLDMDTQSIPKPDQVFDFVYCRHVLEDIQNPDFAFHEMVRTSKAGYIETPSPLVECTRGVDAVACHQMFCGYHHHRYIVWTEQADNSLHFLPKLPLLEYLYIPATEGTGLRQPQYWNNYYKWDATKPAKCVVYKHGVNFRIMSDYGNLLQRGIEQSMRATDELFALFI